MFTLGGSTGLILVNNVIDIFLRTMMTIYLCAYDQ